MDLTITPDFLWDEKVHGWVEPFWVVVEDSDSENILHCEYFLLKRQYAEEEHTLAFTIPIHEPLPPQYFIKVSVWVASLQYFKITFNHLHGRRERFLWAGVLLIGICWC